MLAFNIFDVKKELDSPLVHKSLTAQITTNCFMFFSKYVLGSKNYQACTFSILQNGQKTFSILFF